LANVPYSEISTVAWPAVATGRRASRLAVLAQLLQSQWWRPQVLRQWQLRQAHELIRFAVQLPHVAEAARHAGWSAQRVVDDEVWQRWPILTRQQARELGDALFPPALPARHGLVTHHATSGSTGRPLPVRRSGMFAFMYEAMSLRDQIWHDRDVTATYAVIKHRSNGDANYPAGATLPDWGGSAGDVYKTGPVVVLDIHTPIADMAQWLRRVAPAYLNTFPSAVEGIVDEYLARGWPPPPLRSIRTQGEVLTPALRQKVWAAWAVPIVDGYSAEECGYIAMQAPSQGATPIGESEPAMLCAETALVEVLDDHGQPCRCGEVGRVVVTPLHNFAMPLLRYEVGDYAEVGPPSPCGRGLMVLSRVLGRSRSRIRLPDGSLRFAYNPSEVFAALEAVRQYQILQTAVNRLTLRVVSTRALHADELHRIEAGLARSLGYRFALDVEYVPEIARAANGKFLDIQSDIA